MKQSGIYKITNTANGKFYIGSSCNLRSRKKDHWYQLKINGHHNGRLQNAWNKYGEAVFEFRVIETVENIDGLIPREQFYIDTLRPFYNLASIAGSTRGLVHSEDTKRKLSEMMKGRPGPVMSEDGLRRIVESRKGIPRSPETKEKLRLANLGKKASDEARQKMSASRTGEKRSEEWRANMSRAQAGKARGARSPDAIARSVATRRENYAKNRSVLLADLTKRLEKEGKVCRRCNQLLPVESFARTTRPIDFNPYISYCRKCLAAYNRERRKKKKDSGYFQVSKDGLSSVSRS